ncbi:MAG: protein-L-isoaspartate O-methyltransferase [Myxococcota bacterium]
MSEAREAFLDGLVSVGITDPRVRKAFAAVDRAQFVPDVPADWLYEDGVLPDGVHHSQPWTVARLCGLLMVGSGDRVLEVGTGSGYQTAVLAHLDPISIVTIERDPEWAESARKRLVEFSNVIVVTGDGREGYAPKAPYDLIVVNGAVQVTPPALLEQVASDGRIVVPIGAEDEQEWHVLERMDADTWERTTHGSVRFTHLE